jgi:hypothetical protein
LALSAHKQSSTAISLPKVSRGASAPLFFWRNNENCSFKIHIERQFVKGMTWENRGEWHIDHIIPLATAQNENDVVKLNHHTNLRPMWAKDNLRKSSKLENLL